MSKFKLNPGAFARSGAIVTVHDKPRMIVTPVETAEPKASLDSIKGQIALVYRLQNEEDVTEELDRLSQSRDQDVVGDPR